jgi:hypothetical protein
MAKGTKAALGLTTKTQFGKPGLNRDPMPNANQLAMLFLHEHDVDRRPPSGSKAADALSGALLQALGPAIMDAGTHLKQQEKNEVLQDWTSWKQWALSHQGWKVLKQKIDEDYEENQELIDKTFGRPELASEMTHRKDSPRRPDEKATKLILRAIVLSLLGAMAFGVLGQNGWVMKFLRREAPTSDYASYLAPDFPCPATHPSIEA